ncbi:MAG: hypothetical protein OEY66_09115 [Gammaproteobacteria bacterium]|nr:hypothetical protein [Gammaproteobacteria bacterium]
MKRLFTISALASTLASALTLSTGFALAADQDRERDQDRLQTQEQDRIYGSQLMTQQERLEFRARMRAATSAEEREQIRNEHHERMKVRAKERGVTLPDEPPAMREHKMGPGGMAPDNMMSPGGGRGR